MTSQGSFSGETTTGGLIAFFDHGTIRGSFSFTAADGYTTFDYSQTLKVRRR